MPTHIDTRNLDATAGAVFFAVGRGTEGGGSSYHLSIAGITKGLHEPKWGTVGAVAENSGYSLGTIQVDFGQRGTWPLGATERRTLKPGEKTYVDAVIDQASAYASAHGLPFTHDRADLRADLLSHGDGREKRPSIRFIDAPTRDSINAWAGSPEGKQWIHTHIDYPQVRNATHIAMNMLEKHGSGIAEDKRFEAIALIAKTANQLPGRLDDLEAVLKRGGDYQDLRDQAAAIRHSRKFYAGLTAADVAAGYEDAYASNKEAMDRAHLKVGRRDFAPATEGSDPDIRVALQQARTHGHGGGGPQVLKEGSSGRAVEKLEHNLHTLGYGGTAAQAIHPDRQFDATTRQAVEAFQRDHGLTPVDGKAGPATLSAIDREARALQADMAALGLTDARGKVITPDGYLGAGSQHAINTFQQQHHLPATGMADASTRRAIDAEAAQHRPATPSPAAPAAPAAAPAPERRSGPAAAAPGGERITVVEPYGNGGSNRTLRHGISGEEAFRELKIHHPNTNAAAVRAGDASRVDRTAEKVEGELEAVRRREDRNGIPLVQKDLILTDRSGGRSLMVPSPVAGYVKLNDDGTNSISIYSHPVGDARRELVGQVLHGARGSIPYKTGDFVEYGAPLVRQSDVGSPGAIHAHIEVEPDQYRRYLGDILNDRITLGGKVQAQGPEAAQAARDAQQAPMADGMLVKGERGDEVKALQGKLAALGYTAADGTALGTDGIFGKDTLAALKQFQANNGLDDDGKAGRLTLARLADPAALKAGAQTAAVPVHTEPAAPPAPAAPASMRDPGHAENPRFAQALEKLQGLEQQRVQAGLSPLFANPQEAERAAGQLAYESKVAGMRQIDHVVARPDGTGLFAVQGTPGDPAAQRIFVDRQQAVSQSVEASTRQSAELETQFNAQAQDAQQEQLKGRVQ
ncbi:peptidoglycan-binding domain-containing protein [Stenotrophomonas maltophilia]|jgi:peptidoglycan hydrolase-like protein with peptidoglycan-binding domain|uniref:peptidoglycan-binding domain-containing protein n=1 Tax=Stenotrophomonas maltophilia TaxID=40324 RepID=UPI000C158F1B|nr:peptidoglycan-binding protein [Stenotrophomonas maltophilia]